MHVHVHDYGSTFKPYLNGLKRFLHILNIINNTLTKGNQSRSDGLEIKIHETYQQQ